MFLCSCVFAISLATGAFNSGIGNMLKVQTERYIAFNNLMSSGAIQNFDDGTNIVLIILKNICSTMQNFIQTKTCFSQMITNNWISGIRLWNSDIIQAKVVWNITI